MIFKESHKKIDEIVLSGSDSFLIIRADGPEPFDLLRNDEACDKNGSHDNIRAQGQCRSFISHEEVE
jgi:hypothetical protein